MATTTETPVTQTIDGVSQTIVTETGGEQLSDPAITADDAKATAAPVVGTPIALTGITGTFNGTDGGTQTVTNN